MPNIQIPETHPWWLRYGSSVAAAAAASGVSWILVLCGLHMHSSFMLSAVMLTAWFGGFGSGLLTLALTIPMQFLLQEPSNSFAIHGRAGWAGLFVYLFNALMICVLFRKRYLQRARSAVSPVAVTGGWMWKLDPADGGTVETYSPEFPHLSVMRTLPMWMEMVHPEDRAGLQREIQRGLTEGKLTASFHLRRGDGEVRRVSMLGVKMREDSTSHEYLVATCIEMGSHERPEGLSWRALPTG
ncbi:DUF4118 domain-containing protein [Acidobacteria bacterium AB60]|nr:DUF4118 domain-containing protein [Acidobacteria bacterium AB60]